MKNTPSAQTIANRPNTTDSPTACSSTGKENTTSALKPQFATEARPMPGPRTASGNTSAIMIHGSGPMLMAKAAM